MNWTPSDRFQKLPQYVFSQINIWKKELEDKGVQTISLAIGDPDASTPPVLVQKLIESAKNVSNHGYSPYEGTIGFRNEVASYMKKRFGVQVCPQKEVIALIGSKEGIAHFPQAFCNPGDACIYPDPGYPIFQTSILLAGGNAIALPLRSENNFEPSCEEFEKLLLEHKPKLAILNFPSNPTTAMISKATLTEVVRLAKKHACILAYDNAYCEIYQGTNKPLSILQIEGAEEVAIEIHSLSKSFHMTGWRIGFAVGNSQLVQALLKIKTNIDSGPLLCVQEMAQYALKNYEALSHDVRLLYEQRKEIAYKRLKEMHVEYFESGASFFIWAKVPFGMKSVEFTKKLMDTQGVIVTPGIGFGNFGEGFFRLALTVEEKKLELGFNKLEAFMKSF